MRQAAAVDRVAGSERAIGEQTDRAVGQRPAHGIGQAGRHVDGNRPRERRLADEPPQGGHQLAAGEVEIGAERRAGLARNQVLLGHPVDGRRQRRPDVIPR
jgi:hypothetical protein